VKKLIFLALAGVMLVSSCATTQNMSTEEREAIRRSNENYRRMQTP
jgi:hypothetical protein